MKRFNKRGLAYNLENQKWSKCPSEDLSHSFRRLEAGSGPHTPQPAQDAGAGPESLQEG